MKRYTALLRGINVGNHRRIKMADLIKSVEHAGLKNVVSYIQSGNLVFDSETRDAEAIRILLENRILQDFGFEVPVILLAQKEFEVICKENPYTATDVRDVYMIFMQKTPSSEAYKKLNDMNFGDDQFFTNRRVIYLNLKRKYHETQLNHQLTEKILHVKSTARNLNTVLKINSLLQN